MRKISLFQVMCMGLLISILGTVSVASTWAVMHGMGWSDGLVSTVFFLAFWYLYGVTTHALLRRRFSFRTGEILPHSKDEFYYHVFHLPFLFFWLYPPAFSGLIPVPMTRLFYLLFGARIGQNTYPNRCTIFDPAFVEIGDHVILGHQSMIIPHIIETGRLAHHSIKIGHRVTIGVNAVILAGVTIGDDAIVAAGSVVPKFSHIQAGETWAGIPARPLPSKSSGSTPASEEVRIRPTVIDL